MEKERKRKRRKGVMEVKWSPEAHGKTEEERWRGKEKNNIKIRWKKAVDKIRREEGRERGKKKESKGAKKA